MRGKFPLFFVLVGVVSITITSCSPATKDKANEINGSKQSFASSGSVSNEDGNAGPPSTFTTSNSTALPTGSPWPQVDWILTDTLMVQKKWVTEYNDTLSINLGVYGEKFMYADWHLPPKWAPYLYKNEHWVNQAGQPVRLNNPTLFITLQGTVFLKTGTAGRYWPPLSATDIPPDATIVAEFVPLKPAVKAGIIPVYHSFPQVDTVEPEVLTVLGMREAEYRNSIGSPITK